MFDFSSKPSTKLKLMQLNFTPYVHPFLVIFESSLITSQSIYEAESDFFIFNACVIDLVDTTQIYDTSFASNIRICKKDRYATVFFYKIAKAIPK